MKKSISYQQRLQHRGLHFPATIKLLGSLGDMIISIWLEKTLIPTRDHIEVVY